MKRKSTSLIEEIGILTPLKIAINSVEKGDDNMADNSWFQNLKSADKTALVQDKKLKVHYKFADSNEMVEEYNTDTSCLLRRAWKRRAKIGGEGIWEIEVGDPEPKNLSNLDADGIREADDQPTIIKRCTRNNLEWRIRNLPYPIETYSATANNEDKSITIRTTNKKYFKKLHVLEMERFGLELKQSEIQINHSFNTLIISYKKPTELSAIEKAWYAELKTVKTTKDDIGDCKQS